MFRLVPSLTTALALSDETSLMQGVKPQQVSKEGKSHSVSNLLETAKTMLTNGATNDVVVFAKATLTEIMDDTLPAIQDSHDNDQKLIDAMFAKFAEARADLERGTAEVKELFVKERALSEDHQECRGFGSEDLEGCCIEDPKMGRYCKHEYCACDEKVKCDYDLYATWKHFEEAEDILREHSDKIEHHFCVSGENSTTDIYRDQAVIKFKPWLEQKPVVEKWEVTYDAKVPVCETKYQTMDKKTDQCDDLQTKLELASCAYANKAILIHDNFMKFWDFQIKAYNELTLEVHCLEIDRWKEWRTLKSVECLLEKTSARNGRPCDDKTDEAKIEVTECEKVQHDEDIAHLKIVYPQPCMVPPSCDEVVPTEEDKKKETWGQCLPETPHTPCSDAFVTREYSKLWQPPSSPFSETNSHCNARQACEACSLVSPCALHRDYAIHGWPEMIKPEPEDQCTQRVTGGDFKNVTKDQLKEGDFGGINNPKHDGHFDPNKND